MKQIKEKIVESVIVNPWHKITNEIEHWHYSQKDNSKKLRNEVNNKLVSIYSQLDTVSMKS